MNNNKILLDSVNEYYKLKNAYNIKNQNNNRDNKKCIQCNGQGGSIFESKVKDGNRILLAMCNSRKKCNLNININTGHILNLKCELQILTSFQYDKMDEDNKERNTNYLNKEIIISKNDILYGYTNVNDVEKQLRTLLEDVELQNYAVTSFNSELLSITNNEDKLQNILRLKKEIFEAISNIKNLSATYNETHVQHLLEECDEIYKNVILPKTTELRNIKYQIQYVESTGSNNLGAIYEYIHHPYKESDFEIQMNNDLPDIIFIADGVNNTTSKPPPRKKAVRKTKKKDVPPKEEDDVGDIGEAKEEPEEVRIKGKLRVTKKKKKGEKEIIQTPEVTRETIKNIPKLIKGHYSDDIVFCIYDNAPSALPGKGKYEKIPESDIEDFKTLETFKDWRSRLSNTNHSVFVLDGHKWYSVYHYYMACQFKLANPEFYLSFSLDSGSPISRSISKAREASNMEKTTALRSENIKKDEDYFISQRHAEELFYGMYANIEQHEDLKRILLNTKKAKLMRFVKKDNVSKFVIDGDLIYIRMLIVDKELKLYTNQSNTVQEKVGGNVTFGGNDVKYFESKIEEDGDGDEYDNEHIDIGGEMSIDELDGIEDML